MNSSLIFILEELSLKYDMSLTIYDGKNLKNFPNKESCSSVEQELLINHTPNFDSVDYFQIEGQVYAVFDCYSSEDRPSLNVMIGPFETKKLISSTVGKKSLPLFDTRLVLRYEFTNFITIIFYLLKQSPLPPLPKWLSSNESLYEIFKVSKPSIDSRRFSNTFEDSIELEKRFLDAVRRNKKNEVEWLISKVSSTYSAELSNNYLENVKYKFIGIITLLTRISVNSGVSTIRAYSLSDSLIRTLSEMKNLKDFIKFIKEASFMYIDLIHNFPYSEKSDLIKKIIFYIDDNIYNKITIENIAEFTGKHKSYISSEFKKEMNQTIHTYINKKKVFEAKHLLILTNQNYKDIATQLNFSSQSHFINIFKKHEGISPAQYRLENNQRYMLIE